MLSSYNIPELSLKTPGKVAGFVTSWFLTKKKVTMQCHKVTWFSKKVAKLATLGCVRRVTTFVFSRLMEWRSKFSKLSNRFGSEYINGLNLVVQIFHFSAVSQTENQRGRNWSCRPRLLVTGLDYYAATPGVKGSMEGGRGTMEQAKLAEPEPLQRPGADWL